jgi:hypothetical protein
MVCSHEKDKRCCYVPEHVFEDIKILDFLPFLLQSGRLTALLIVPPFGAPTDVVDTADCVNVEQDQIGRVVENEGQQSPENFDNQFALTVHEGVEK